MPKCTNKTCCRPLNFLFYGSTSLSGVLFLDEMPEFSRRSLEILRQPLEDKVIRIARTTGTYEFPANFMLCAAMNPCPCGFYPDMNQCRCTAGEVAHYLGKISQPLLDRIDLCAEAAPVDFSQISSKKTGESSCDIRKRVETVREIQKLRFSGESIRFNGEMGKNHIDKYCYVSESAQKLLERAFKKIRFSARSYHRILKVARTIADMDGSEKIESRHAGEAISYRAFDKKYWS
ncbi:MAG TPA: ATP-binding protein [Candidatus Blautia faecavium]|uniref:ATP-binding protein n=1 Tax=Candidatus Blautia faecavium TaxID=2838487 RepID=A0A9D2LWN7_9FIRM|nr:ATP-binding protein [Candidatus Blautia faecavium]